MLPKKIFLGLLLLSSLFYSTVSFSLDTHTDGKPIYKPMDVTVESFDVTVEPFDVTVEPLDVIVKPMNIALYYPLPDGDNDGVNNDVDNCKYIANADQLDTNKNGVGDACEPPGDQDKDGIFDAVDNCPTTPNKDQKNYDKDAKGDACDPDDDNDGLPDTWELAHQLNPFNAGDAVLDADNDGLTNKAEYQQGTDPNNWDTDGDGVSDGDEVKAGTDPTVKDQPTNGKAIVPIIHFLLAEDQINPCDSGYSLVYALDRAHPSGSLGSSGNKIFLTKLCYKDTEIKTLKRETLGGFKNQPNQYDVNYSYTNKPFNGYSGYSYYQNTKYNGLSEREMYASGSYVELIQKIKAGVDANQCKQVADNFSGGNLNRDDNMWTVFCPKEALLSRLKSLWSDE